MIQVFDAHFYRPTLADDPDYRIYNDLLKKEFMMWVHSKGDGFK